jgi:hypothetical protein
MEKGEMSEAGSSRHLPGDGPEGGACEGTNTKGSAPPVRLLIADDAKRLAANTRHKVIISTVATDVNANALTEAYAWTFKTRRR